MNKKYAKFYTCPRCRAKLKLKICRQSGSEILEGELYDGFWSYLSDSGWHC